VAGLEARLATVAAPNTWGYREGMTASQPRTASLLIDDQLCFALYASSRAMTGRYRALLDDLDLTYPQYIVMLVLWEEGTVTVNQLGRRLQLDSGTLSPLLKRLESIGYVTRRRRLEDERSVEIGLTERGLRLRQQAEAVPGRLCEIVRLPYDERCDLIDQLRHLTATLLEDDDRN
jgi:MarR family transcriptional regulator, organic hydroperoxide resistance regulator